MGVSEDRSRLESGGELDDSSPADPRPSRHGQAVWVVAGLVVAAITVWLLGQASTPSGTGDEPSASDSSTTDSPARVPSASDEGGTAPPEPGSEPQPQLGAESLPDIDRLLYPRDRVAGYRDRMSEGGPYYRTGDAGHGGSHSPGDGQHAEALAEEFLDDPAASYWSQSDLPYDVGDPKPDDLRYVAPMHAAWLAMTRPGHPERDRLDEELKAWLLAHAEDSSLDFSNADDYPVDFPGHAASPIFETAQWMTRAVKTRDMVGRQVFTVEENATLDRWFHGYANWTASWLHLEVYGDALPGRLERDYSSVRSRWSNREAASFDDGPMISTGALAYSNRHAAVASAMSAAANYLAYFDYDGQPVRSPSYGVYDVDELLEHSRLFVEEALRFSVYPEGLQGDFERGDPNRHDASPQQGWLYSINVLANLLEIAEYHAARGDLSVWEFGTTEGHAGSEGAPTEGGFSEKNLHFFAWAMSRYVNDGWGRTNQGETLVDESFYHDVLTAAMAHRFVPEDTLLKAAWRREGKGFPSYPESPQVQGPYDAHQGEGAKSIGLIEVAPIP